MELTDKHRELAEFLNKRCKGRYCPTTETIRFIPNDVGASTQFLRVGRLATELGVAPNGRDLTFFGERKISLLDQMGVTIDRTVAAQQQAILER